MREASKAIARRLHDHRFVSRYFVGNGIGGFKHEVRGG